MPLTKKEINNFKLEPPRERAILPVIPAWSRRVNGRLFGQYLAIARKKPRRSFLLLPIANPCSPFANIWGSITTFNDFTYTAFIVPLSLAFNNYATPNAYWYLDLIGSSVYILDLLIEFHVGFIVKWDASSVTITDGRQVAKNYVLNGTFFIDLIASLPVFGQVAVAITTEVGGQNSNAAVRSIELLKLLRLGRVVRLIAQMNKFDTGGILQQWISSRVNSLTMFAFNTFFSLMVMLNLLACMWWWIAVIQGLENSWVAAFEVNKPEINLYDASDASRWLVGAYFGLCTISTIGYGDITPVTKAEIGLVIIFIFSGVAFFGFVLSTVSALLESRTCDDSLSGGDWGKFQDMENWMKKYSFPKKLQRVIRKHCYTSSVLAASQDGDFYSVMPLWLKVKIAVELQKTGIIALLGGQSVWDTLPEDTQTAVAKTVALVSEPKSMVSGSQLYAFGDKSESIYFVEEGQLGLYVPGAAKMVTISSPSVLGAGSLFSDWSEACSSCKATARTISRCLLWKINASMLKHELYHIAPEVLQIILDHYVQVLKRTRAQLEHKGKSRQQAQGTALLKQAYDAQIEGAAVAAAALKARVEQLNLEQQQPQKEVERRETAINHSENSSMKTKEGRENLEWQRLAGMVHQEVAGSDNSPEAGAATRLLEMEVQHSIRAGEEDAELDIERNVAAVTLGEDLEDKLDHSQASMYLEEVASKAMSMSTAAGIVRKGSNATFVV